jgi:hypothetical protein
MRLGCTSVLMLDKLGVKNNGLYQSNVTVIVRNGA